MSADFSDKRVALVTGYYPTPVLARTLVELAKRAKATAGRLVFIFIYWWKDLPRPDFLNDLEREGVEVKELTILGPLRQGLARGWIRSPADWWAFNWKAFGEARAYFQCERFHLVLFLHIPWHSEFFLTLAARMAMVPYVGKLFTSTQLPVPLYRRLAHFLSAQMLTRVLVISPEAKWFLWYVGYLTPRYTIIRSLGVVGRQFQKSDANPQAVRQVFGVPPGAPVIGTVCRIDPVKGQKYFIETVAKLRIEFPEIRGFIVGGQYDPAEPWEKELRAQAAALGVADRVIFAGMREDVENFYAAFDVYVHPALYDLFPYSVLEAMSMELPVVATRVGGIPDMVVEGETGLLVPPKDSEALASAITRLLRDPEMRRDMGRNGRERVLANWTMDRAFADVLSCFKDILDRHPRRIYQ
ncbi:MAG: glycosyltransferase family 4 protein [bacterium]